MRPHPPPYLTLPVALALLPTAFPRCHPHLETPPLRPQFAKLNLTAGTTYEARDIWARESLGTASAELSLTVPAYDSVFVLLTPKAAAVA